MRYYLIKVSDKETPRTSRWWNGECKKGKVYWHFNADKQIELTEEELEYIMEYADEYNYFTPDLETKIRKVLK